MNGSGPGRSERIEMEDERIRQARAVVDSALLKIQNARLSRDEALDLVGEVRSYVLDLFPGGQRVFDLVLLPRFKRAIDEYARV